MALAAPIAAHVEALAAAGYPAAAIDNCVQRPRESVPVLLALLRRAARGGAGGRALDEAEASQLFLGLHILAKLREEAACAPLLRLLRQPVEAVEAILGDASIETLPKVAASVFDGDAEALFDVIADAAVADVLRDALWCAAVTLTLSGRIAAEATAEIVERFDDERLAPPGDMGWLGWLQAIADLGLTAMAPRVEPLWSDGRLPEKVIGRRDFRVDLAAGVAGRPVRPRGGLITDIAADLDWVDWQGTPEPYRNPMRDVGRNDPCPCGSGRKAKKCCLVPT